MPTGRPFRIVPALHWPPFGHPSVQSVGQQGTEADSSHSPLTQLAPERQRIVPYPDTRPVIRTAGRQHLDDRGMDGTEMGSRVITRQSGGGIPALRFEALADGSQRDDGPPPTA